MSQWRDIASAPRQRIILLWAITCHDPPNWKMGSGNCAVNYDGDLEWTWDGRILREWEPKPTHWQPLPEPPIAGATEPTSAGLNAPVMSAERRALEIARDALRQIACSASEILVHAKPPKWRCGASRRSCRTPGNRDDGARRPRVVRARHGRADGLPGE